ncbi:MAG: glycogen synthase GlgA [Chitinispirillaceae bacterium]|nr:glycogen synthase GlgA [Chitinispirillaceae bacterium]
MNIVHATAELYPYAKTGGLADMAGALVSTLAAKGHAISVFMPGYREVFEHPDAHAAEGLLALGNSGGEIRTFSPEKNLTVFLVCNRAYFDRNGIYGNDGRDFDDNQQRYIFFIRAVVETMRSLRICADIVHCHDWQTALLPLLLQYARLRYGVTLAKKTVFTIHNIAFQGTFPMRSFDRAGLPEELAGISDLEYYGQINMLKGGLIFADQVTTVSPRYAREIRTTEFGCGLDKVVAMRGDRLIGLLNGIDSAVWNPVTDEYLPSRYSAADMSGKYLCRKELLKKLSLGTEYNGPVFGMVCRLTGQKGIDLVLANKDLFTSEGRLIVLGTGERRYEEALATLAASATGKIAFCNRQDEALSHLVEAGSDFFLMPSLFEPCGLNQMYSQNYGTVPLVSRVGGLCDTVTDVDREPESGTGITFPPDAAGFRDGLLRALRLFADTPRLVAVQQRGMRKDFSWINAAMAYEQLYRETLASTSIGQNQARFAPLAESEMARAG